jgi:hypothetical protein
MRVRSLSESCPNRAASGFERCHDARFLLHNGLFYMDKTMRGPGDAKKRGRRHRQSHRVGLHGTLALRPVWENTWMRCAVVRKNIRGEFEERRL